MTYEDIEAGVWVEPVRRGYKMACCDCGLVHVFDFRVEKRLVQFRVHRAERATGQVRRWMRKRGEGIWTQGSAA